MNGTPEMSPGCHFVYVQRRKIRLLALFAAKLRSSSGCRAGHIHRRLWKEIGESSVNKRIEWIDTAKGIAIFLIVAGHCADKNGPDRILLHFSMFAGVGIFFLLSGMTFCWKSGSFPWFDHRPARRFFGNLWRSLIVPYLFWGFISIGIYGILGKRVAEGLASDRKHFGIAPNLLGMLYGNSGSGYMEWNRPLWFLVCLVWVELIWYAVLRSKRSVLLSGAAMILPFLWIIGQNMAGIHLCLPWELETAVCVLPYFGAGRLLRGRLFDSEESIPKHPTERMLEMQREDVHPKTGEQGTDQEVSTARRRRLPAVFGVAALADLWLLLHGTSDADFRADRFSAPELFIPEMLLGIFGILTAARFLSGVPQVNRWIRYLGQRTLAVLVMHKFPVMAMKLLLHGKRECIGMDLLMAVVTVLLCLAAERAISTLCPAVFGRPKKRKETPG